MHYNLDFACLSVCACLFVSNKVKTAEPIRSGKVYGCPLLSSNIFFFKLWKSSLIMVNPHSFLFIVIFDEPAIIISGNKRWAQSVLIAKSYIWTTVLNIFNSVSCQFVILYIISCKWISAKKKERKKHYNYTMFT